MARSFHDAIYRAPPAGMRKQSSVILRNKTYYFPPLAGPPARLPAPQEEEDEEGGEEGAEAEGAVRTGMDVDAGEEAGDDGIPVQVRMSRD